MDLEGTDDDMSEHGQLSNVSYKSYFEEESLDYGEPTSYSDVDSMDYGDPPYFNGGIVRVPLILLDSLAATAKTIAHYSRYDSSILAETWMKAIAVRFRDTPLGELRATDPSLLPLWLLERDVEDWVVLGPGGIFARRDTPICCTQPGPNAKSILAATLQCRLREGFASEGMLCNNPPIPLRVLDFLEHAEDLLNLALVCKATHQAGHVLLQREFGDDLDSHDIRSIGIALERRKKSMLESAMRHPIPNATASTSIPASKTGTKTGTAADAEEADHLCEVLTVTAGGNCTDRLMFTLLPLVTQVDPMLPGGMLDWRDHYYERSYHFSVAMDEEAVKTAAALLEDFDLDTPDAMNWNNCHAREVVQVVHAAKREGQGLMLHRCFVDQEACYRSARLWVSRKAQRHTPQV